MTDFWRRIVDEPDTFPPGFWQLFFLQTSLTALGGKAPSVLRGHDMEEEEEDHPRRGYR